MGSPANRLPSLDGLRAASILLVILSHATLHGGPPRALASLAPYVSGELDVRFFFVISGFIITTLLLREAEDRGGVSLPRFYLRRFVRLAPVQLAYVACLFVLTRTTALNVTACQFATALTYTKNYACGAWIDGHLWSLSVEEQFYLVWPLALVALPRRPAVAFAFSLIAPAPFSRAWEYHLGARNFAWLTSNADALMAGCLAAMFFTSPVIDRVSAWRPALGRLLAVVGMMIPVLLSSQMMAGVFTVTLGRSMQVLCAAYLICSLLKVQRGWSYAWLNAAPIIFVGRISYSLYVWQQIFFTDPREFGFATSSILAFPLNIGLACLAGVASYYLLELPFDGLRRALSGPRARQNRAAASASA